MTIYKNECFLGIDGFGRNKEITGVNAHAYRIQNLLFFEPGTDPSLPEMGIGIKNFQFELATTDEISSIALLIKEQIAKWLPDIMIDELVVELLNNERLGIKNTLGILVKISSKPGTTDTMAILLNNDGPNNNVISQVYFS